MFVKGSITTDAAKIPSRHDYNIYLHFNKRNSKVSFSSVEVTHCVTFMEIFC